MYRGYFALIHFFHLLFILIIEGKNHCLNIFHNKISTCVKIPVCKEHEIHWNIVQGMFVRSFFGTLVPSCKIQQ